MSRLRQWKAEWTAPLVALVVFLAAWEALVRVASIDPLILPPPSSVISILVRRAGYLAQHGLLTLVEAVLGFIVGGVVAVGLALLFQLHRTAERVGYPYAIAFKSVPLVALAPLTEIWIGGMASKVVLAAVISFFPILVATFEGLRSVDPLLIDLFRAHSATRQQVLFKLRFPAAIPALFSGMKVSSTFSVVGAVVAEFVSSQRGIGYVVKSSSYYLETSLTFAGIVVAAGVGLLFFWVVSFAESRVVFWQAKARATGAEMDLALFERRVARSARLIDLHRAHPEAYTVNFLGLDLTILPEVFCPTYGEGSQQLGACLQTVTERNVLEVGTGSGALAALAARTAERILATDIVPEAVECARQNIRRLGLEGKVQVEQGDLFGPVPKGTVFDLVLFNPPFMEGTPHSPLEMAMFDDHYRTLKQFFDDLPRYLAHGGRVLLAFSSVGDVELLHRLIGQQGFTRQLVEDRNENGLRFFVYELRRQESTV